MNTASNQTAANTVPNVAALMAANAAAGNNAAAASNGISRESEAGKKLITALGNGSRVEVASEALDAKIASIQATNPDFPIYYAGGSLEKMLETPTASYVVSFVQHQVKATADSKAIGHFRCILVFPLFSIEQILEAENGRDWVEKLIEKEAALVSHRPMRGEESGEDLEANSQQVPCTISALITATGNRAKVDTEALSVLWPILRSLIKEQSPGAYEFMPADKAVAHVAKALRSKEWAERNESQLEKLGAWVMFGKAMIAFGKAGIKGADGNTIEYDVSAIEGWLEKRDITPIEPVAAPRVRDEGALETFLSGFGNLLGEDGSEE